MDASDRRISAEGDSGALQCEGSGGGKKRVETPKERQFQLAFRHDGTGGGAC